MYSRPSAFFKKLFSELPQHLAHAIATHPDSYRDHRDTKAMVRVKPHRT